LPKALQYKKYGAKQTANWFATIALCVAVLLCGQGASGQDTAQTKDDSNLVSVTSLEAISPADESVGSRAISKGRSLIHDFERHGISFPVSLVTEASANLRGTPNGSRWFVRDLFNASIAIDGQKALGWKGSSALIRLSQHVQRGNPESVGEVQIYSNIGAGARTSLYELWFQQVLSNEKLRIKAGKIDATTEFAVVQTAADFLNSSMGYSPTIMGFPTYPEPKPGASIFFVPTKNFGLSMGVFQTAGLGTLSIAEPAHSWTTIHDLPGRASLGYWRLDGGNSRLDGSTSSVTQGFYGVLEQSLWRDDEQGQAKDRNLSAYFQFGKADGSVSPITMHLGGGFVMQSPLSTRPKDSAGIAVTAIRFSDCPAAGFDLNGELVFEAYYKFRITEPLAFIPDFQFLHHPGGLSSDPNSPVLSQRLVFSF
jgi:porin